MNSKSINLLVVVIISLLNIYMTCIPRLYSPPTRLWPLESPSSLKKGKNAISIAGGGHVFPADFNAVSGTINYRRGITDNLEACAGLSMLYVNFDDSRYYPTISTGSNEVSPLTGSIRIGAKYNPSIFKRFFALYSGIGFGFTEVGQYMTVDIGEVLGFENPYVVPYVTWGFELSIPFNTKEVNFGSDNDNDGFPDTDEAETTYGPKFGLGLKMQPFEVNKDYFPVFYFLSSISTLNSANDKDELKSLSFGGGVEIPF